MPKKLKLYVGCSLNGATVAFRQEVEVLKDSLRDTFEVLDFVGLVAKGFEKVYQWDIEHCVKNCDIFVAICDQPSIGLGYELAVAIREFNKPVLAVAHKDSSVSGLLRGIPHGNFTLKRYANFHKEVPHLIDRWVASLNS